MVCANPGARSASRINAASPRASSRATSTRRAPMAASRSAAICPIPEVAPVITITFPCMVQCAGITDGPRSESAATVPRFGPHSRCRASGSPSGGPRPALPRGGSGERWRRLDLPARSLLALCRRDARREREGRGRGARGHNCLDLAQGPSLRGDLEKALDSPRAVQGPDPPVEGRSVVPVLPARRLAVVTLLVDLSPDLRAHPRLSGRPPLAAGATEHRRRISARAALFVRVRVHGDGRLWVAFREKAPALAVRGDAEPGRVGRVAGADLAGGAEPPHPRQERLGVAGARVDLIIVLRKRNVSIDDVHGALNQQGCGLGLTAIHEVLRADAFSRPPRRHDGECPHAPRPEPAAVAIVG